MGARRQNSAEQRYVISESGVDRTNTLHLSLYVSFGKRGPVAHVINITYSNISFSSDYVEVTRPITISWRVYYIVPRTMKNTFAMKRFAFHTTSKIVPRHVASSWIELFLLKLRILKQKIQDVCLCPTYFLLRRPGADIGYSVQIVIVAVFGKRCDHFQ